MLAGNVGQRGLVALDVGELPPLLVLEVEHQHALMVGGYPKVVLHVVADFPHLHILRHIAEALGTHHLCQRRVPAALLLGVDVQTRGVSDDPDILFTVDAHPIVVIGIEGTLDVVLLPKHLPRLAVDAQQFAVGRHQHHTLLALGTGRNAELFGEVMGAVAKVDVGQPLRGRVQVVQSVVIGLHPVVLLRVDVDILQTARHAILCQPAHGVTLHRLGL